MGDIKNEISECSESAKSGTAVVKTDEGCCCHMHASSILFPMCFVFVCVNDGINIPVPHE